MHQNLTPHTQMHRNRHSSGKSTDILTLTHECTEIMIHQVNTPESYPSHMNAPKSSLLKLKHRNPDPHTLMNRIHHPASKCTRILPLTHKCTEIVIPHVNAPKSYPHTWTHRNHHPSSICTGILPLTNECTEIVTPQVNATKSYPSHMNEPNLSSLK